ncbi:sugar phosphate isomerase/epimerase [bacterium]|nr:sugar phosphate isomerase/epimerase [bacterium]
MIKLGVFSDEVSQDLDRAIALAKEFNLSGLEIRSVWNKPPEKLGDDAAKIRSALDEAGLECYSIASPFFKCNLASEDDYREHLDILRRCIRLAKALGTNNVRGFTFWRKASPTFEEARDTIIEKFREPVSMIEGEGIYLCIENESSTYIASGVKLRRLIEDIGSPNVRVTWDPCNCLFDPSCEPPYPEGYEAVRDVLRLVHVKDAVKVPDERLAEHVPIGEGDNPLRELFSRLKGDGYDGYLSLETHWRPTKELAKDLVDRPGGAAYSEDAELASRVCLENMTKMFEEA